MLAAIVHAIGRPSKAAAYRGVLVQALAEDVMLRSVGRCTARAKLHAVDPGD